MILAYPGQKSEISEHVTRDTFINALENSDLEFKIREREPKTLEEAVRITQRLEVFKITVDISGARSKINRNVTDDTDLEIRITNMEHKLVEPQQQASANNTSTTQNGDKVNKARFNNSHQFGKNRAVGNDDQRWKIDMKKQLDELRTEQVTVLNQNQALSKEVDRLKHLDQVRSMPIWNQPRNTVLPSQAQSSNAVRTPVICYNCNKPGHISRNCGVPRRGNRSIPQNTQENQARSMHVGGTKCKNRRANGHATYLKATIGTHTVDCLLDTGSETTIIPASLVSSSDIQRKTHTLTAANGTSVPLLGEVTLFMHANRQADYLNSGTCVQTYH